jgi:hypothetical protein
LLFFFIDFGLMMEVCWDGFDWMKVRIW